MAIPPKIKGTQSDKSEVEKSWELFVTEQKQKEAERLEDTAKFLVGIISISLTLFISNRPETYEAWLGNSFLIATALWMLSAMLCFFVLFPWRYSYRDDSPESIQSAYRKIAKVKRGILILGVIAFLIALGIASYEFVNTGSTKQAPQVALPADQ